MKLSTIIISILFFTTFSLGLFSFINLNVARFPATDRNISFALNKTKEFATSLEKKTLELEERQGLVATLLTTTVIAWDVLKYTFTEAPKTFIFSVYYIVDKFQIDPLFTGSIIAAVMVSLVFLLIKSLVKWEI
ncbi:MAG: hypothetical protein RMJ67_06675 [Elusimicrobiota bacterium]|nr:hypothetical protein [Endomicrobiia bacterium]MDW8166178.1 hypothetical protein [Elusimicrobiota bacterium]